MLLLVKLWEFLKKTFTSEGRAAKRAEKSKKAEEKELERSGPDSDGSRRDSGGPLLPRHGPGNGLQLLALYQRIVSSRISTFLCSHPRSVLAARQSRIRLARR